VASSSEATPEKKTAPASSAPLPDAGDASLIDDETQELLDQGVTGVAVVGYRQAPVAPDAAVRCVRRLPVPRLRGPS
jgi:hypothetical protein